MCICLNNVVILVIYIIEYIMGNLIGIICQFSQVFLSEKHFFDKCKKLMYDLMMNYVL